MLAVDTDGSPPTQFPCATGNAHQLALLLVESYFRPTRPEGGGSAGSIRSNSNAQ